MPLLLEFLILQLCLWASLLPLRMHLSLLSGKLLPTWTTSLLSLGSFFFPSEGVNSMKSIMMCSNGLSRGGWVANASTSQALPGLLEMQMRHASQIFLSDWSEPCNKPILIYFFQHSPCDTRVNMTKWGEKWWRSQGFSFGPIHVDVEWWQVTRDKCDKHFSEWQKTGCQWGKRWERCHGCDCTCDIKVEQGT